MERAPVHPNASLLQSATTGFDALFSNDIASAREIFQGNDDPFHIMGLGVCAFLEAALGMESGLMTEASRCLALAEAGTRKQMRVPKPRDLDYHSRFHYGLEWEILNADSVVLLGLTHALSESYMGYLQCLYALNSAHSKFTKLYKTVFPAGISHLSTSLDSSTGTSRLAPPVRSELSHKPSLTSLSSQSSASSVASGQTVAPSPLRTSFFSRLVGGSTASLPVIPSPTVQPDGAVEELIEAGTAFGFGLFNLVFSLLPKKIQGLVGFLGFQHDRKLALVALALAASKRDVHGVFAGLVLMTYHGVVLLLSGYQADEQRIVDEYKSIVDRIETKYPAGALWILNRAKILRMTYDAEGAIKVLQDGLKPDRPISFIQADTLLMFELAWTLLSQRRYQEAAESFIKITELNSWSHGTYYFIAAGCYAALDEKDKAQSLLDAIPILLEKKKVGGKDLPTEVFIKKKLAFWKDKHLRQGGDGKRFVDCIHINPAEEIGIFWNTHARISPSIAQAHIDGLLSLSPSIDIQKLSPSSAPKSPQSPNIARAVESLSIEDNLDTPDELATRYLLLGVNYRTRKEYKNARVFLTEAHTYPDIKVSTWVAGVATFELAVLDLKEMEDKDPSLAPGEVGERKRLWGDALKAASAKLDLALTLAPSSVDLSSRLDSRIVMLRDQIAAKREQLGIAL